MRCILLRFNASLLYKRERESAKCANVLQNMCVSAIITVFTTFNNTKRCHCGSLTVLVWSSRGKSSFLKLFFSFLIFMVAFLRFKWLFSNLLFTSTFFPRFFSPMIASMNRRWNKRGYCVRCSARREHKLNVFFFCLWFSYRHLFIPIGFVLMNFFAASQQMYRAICVQCWRNTLPEYHIKSDWQWVDVRLHESEQRRKMIENVGQPKSSNQPSKWLS